MNAHALLDWFKIRCCMNAQAEIRDLANKMLRLCKEAAPALFEGAGTKLRFARLLPGERVSASFLPCNSKKRRNGAFAQCNENPVKNVVPAKTAGVRFSGRYCPYCGAEKGRKHPLRSNGIVVVLLRFLLSLLVLAVLLFVAFVVLGLCCRLRRRRAHNRHCDCREREKRAAGTPACCLYRFQRKRSEQAVCLDTESPWFSTH